MIEQYYREHLQQWRSYVQRRVGDALLAEDIVQDAFERLWLMGAIVSPKTLHALVATIINRRLIDYYRRRQHRETFERQLYTAADSEGAASVYAPREMWEWIERGISQLPQSCQEVYRLHLLQGMPPRQIAEQTHIQYKTVENRLGQARKAIRRFLLPLVRDYSLPIPKLAGA